MAAHKQLAAVKIWHVALVGGFLVLTTIIIIILSPYNFDHTRQIHAARFQAGLNLWAKQRGSETNILQCVGQGPRSRAYLFRTNLHYEGRVYETAVALEHSGFRNRGRLVGTTNADVFWLGRDGSIKAFDGEP